MSDSPTAPFVTATPAESPLLVFVSSVMDPAVDDLTEEREAARTAIDSLRITRSWAFEHSPASADTVDEAYLTKVDECDLFLSILGSHLTDPVETEYARALSQNKRRLLFVKNAPSRSPRAALWLSQRHDVKWKRFEGSDDLGDHVQAAVIDDLVKSYRRLNLSSKDLEQIATQLRSEPVSFMVRTIAAKELGDVTQTFPQLTSRYPDFENWVTTKAVEITNKTAVAYVASYGSENAGFALVSDKGPGVRKISTLFIKPRYQSHGIGPRLLFGVVEQAAHDAVEKLYITLSDDLRETLEPLLARFGFYVEGVSARRYGSGTWEWVWSKRLLHGRLRPPQLHSFVRRVMFEERGFAIENTGTRVFKATQRYGVLGEPTAGAGETLVATAEGTDPTSAYRKARAQAQDLGIPLVFVSIDSLPLTPDYGVCLDALDLEERFFPMYVENRSEGLIVPIREQFVQNLIPRSTQLQMVLPSRVQLRTDNVYYRYPSVFGELRRGSAVYFYETQRKQGQSQLIGEGRLVEYVVDEPEELLGRFGNLGVYTLGEVQGCATMTGVNKGKALALHFDWYREASAPLSLAKLKTILPSFDPTTARRVQPSDVIELRRLAGWNVDSLSFP